MKETALYEAPDNTSLRHQPIPSGTEITVTGISEDKKWYRITDSGKDGYIETGNVAVFSE